MIINSLKERAKRRVKLSVYVKPYIFFAILAPLFMVGEVMVDLMQPTLMSKIVDDGVVAGNMPLIWELGLRMIILTLIGGACGIACGYFANYTALNFGLL